MSKRLGIVLLTAAAAIALFVGLSSTRSQGAAGPVAVYPTQGTPVASPTSQVSFRGASVSDLGQVTVDGSKTGHHDGTLKAHSDGNGASFVPATPFAPGETVTVRSSAASLVGAVNGAVTFTILTPPAGKPPKPQLLADPGGHPRVPQFHTRRDIQAPGLQILKRTAAAAPGSIFVGAKAGPGADGPAIYNGTNGQLVWFHRMPRHQSAFDFRVQQYQGGQVLTWWQGRAIFPGEGLGVGMIYDTSYRHIATVRAGNGYKSDLHEFQLTPQGTALLVAYRPVSWDLTPAHGARRAVAVDCVLQEVDVKTGLVEREWHSLGHVSVADSAIKPMPKIPFDAFHLNSVEQEQDGNWLVSSRSTNALYEIDRNTGQVLYTIGGKHSSFKMGRGAQSLGQHDARRAPDGNITVFDNGTFGIKVGRASRTLEIAVDTTAKTVSLVHGFVHRRPTLRTFSQGSTQTLPNGNLLVGWGGANAYITEFSKSGSVVFDALLHPTGDDTYRAYRLPWSGATPAETPRAAAAISHGATNVWASWNGATDIARWQVLGGSSSTSLAPVRSAAYSGFETALKISGARRFAQVQALDASGKVLGSSAVVRASG